MFSELLILSRFCGIISKAVRKPLILATFIFFISHHCAPARSPIAALAIASLRALRTQIIAEFLEYVHSFVITS